MGLAWARAVAAFASLGMMLAAGILPLGAADRSVTIFEGAEEPPAPAPLPPDMAPLTGLKTDNPAGVTLEILPNASPRLGTRIAFSISTQQPGYLILVDINAENKLTQIFPNMLTLSQTSGDVGSANLIKPGLAITIPNPKNPLARFVFTADLPRGSGAIVAMLSDKPVQLIDLPEVPDAPPGLQGLIDLVTRSVLGLKIAASGEPGTFTQGSWSFAATPYVVE